MKNHTHYIIRHLALLAGAALAFTTAHAQIRTWTGGGTDDYWSTGANWGGTAPGVTGGTLVFAGSTRLTPDNTNVTSVNGITFAAGADSFTLGGDGFTLAGDITNNSGVLQTINNAITLNGSRVINTGTRDIRINGAIGETGSARNIQKHGTGTLTLVGANTFTGNIELFQGKILLDAASGGSLAAGNVFYFGMQVVPTDINQGGIFEVRGASTGSTTVTVDKALYLGRSSGANRIIVDSNGGDETTLVFTNFGRLSHPNSGETTLNVDLSSSANNAFQLTASAAMQNGIYTFMTVTDTTKTGFATRDTNTGFVTRNTVMSNLPTTGSFGALNTSTAGTQALTGNTLVNSLTITGSGTVTGNYYLAASALLMEEDVGNYTIGTASFGNGSLHVHQYSTNGILTISGDLRGAGNYSGNSFAKTGPGAVVLTKAAENVGGAADVQSGSLQLDGSLRAVQVVQVRDGATLSGSGEIGGGIAWAWNGANTNTGTRYTPVNVWSGGTLDASYFEADALAITGKLTLYAGSTFQMDLAGGAFDVLSVTNITPTENIVTLDGDLKLTLNYTPTLGEQINLLTSSGGLITGTFATINGQAATPTFFLGDYKFGINYDTDRVWLNTLAIPEPSTVMLLLLTGAFGLACCRRK